MRLLVTGGAGMLGQAVAAAATRLGHDVVALSRAELDITDADHVRRVIAAAEPRFVSREDVPADALEKEREIALAQVKNDPKNANKPEQIVQKIVEGLMNRYYEGAVLLDQPFVKEPSKTVGELVTEKVAKTGEKITIRRFTRYKMGEGLDKRSEDLWRRSRFAGQLEQPNPNDETC